MKKLSSLILAIIFGLFLISGCADDFDEGFGQEDQPFTDTLNGHDDDPPEPIPPPPPGS